MHSQERPYDSELQIVSRIADAIADSLRPESWDTALDLLIDELSTRRNQCASEGERNDGNVRT